MEPYTSVVAVEPAKVGVNRIMAEAPDSLKEAQASLERNGVKFVV